MRFEILPVDSDNLRAFSQSTKGMPISKRPIYTAGSRGFAKMKDRLPVAAARTKTNTSEIRALRNNLSTSSLLSFILMIQNKDHTTEDERANAMPTGSFILK